MTASPTFVFYKALKILDNILRLKKLLHFKFPINRKYFVSLVTTRNTCIYLTQKAKEVGGWHGLLLLLKVSLKPEER